MAKENQSETWTDHARDRVIREGRDFAREFSGLEERRRSKLGFWTGFSAFSSAGRSVVALAGGAARNAYSVTRMALGREQAPALPTDSTDPKARFALAQELYGRSDEEVAVMEQRSRRQAFLLFIMTLLSLCWGILLLPTAVADSGGPLSYLFPFFLIFPLSALTLRAAFWHWQLRHRSLRGFREFMSSGEVLCFTSGRRGTFGTFLLLAMTGAMLFPSMAYAYAPFDWTANLGDGDLFHGILRYVLPNVGPIGNVIEGSPSPAAEAISNAFGAFNATLLMIGGGLLGWHTIAGTIATAHEGKVLGQKWHYIWAPLRVTAGVGFLAPVAGGFCAAQLLVLQLIVWGGGMANTVWIAYVNTYTGKNSTEVTQTLQESLTGGMTNPEDEGYQLVGLAETLPFIKEVTAKSVCYQTVLGYNDDHTDGDGAMVQRSWLGSLFRPDTPVIPATYPELQKQELRYETYYEWDFGPLCGSIRFDLTSHETLGEALRAGGMTRNSRDYREEIDQFVATVANAVQNNVIPDLHDFARQFVSIGSEPSAEDFPFDLNAAHPKIHSARIAYERALMEAAEEAFELVQGEIAADAATKLTEEAETKGWAASGVFYMTLARMQSAVLALTEISPSISSIDLSVIDSDGELHERLVGRNEEGEDDRARGYLNVFEMYWQQALSSDHSFSPEALKAGQVTANSHGWLTRSFEYVFSTNLLNTAIRNMQVRPYNAMMDMVSYGHRLLNWWMTALIVYMGLKSTVIAAAAGGVGGAVAGGVGSFLGAIGGAVASSLLKSAVSGIDFLIKILFIIALVVGVLHAYILPMIPYIMMLFFIMGMLILTVEALVAAPIWAFFHVRLDGQEFVDQVQRPGYMIAFNLLLRPSLAIFGLLLSYIVFGAMAWFMNVTFFPAAMAATAGNGYGFLGIITMMVVTAYLHWQLAIRSFSLITQIPDRVTRWFGQGGEQLGEENEAQKSTQFIIGNVTSRMDRMAGGVGVVQALNSRTSSESSNGPKTNDNFAPKDGKP